MTAVVQKKKSYFSPLHFCTGAVSGIFSRTVTNPLERLKILRQLKTAEFSKLSVNESFAYMWKQEGIKGFFKGNGANAVRVGPFYAYQFFFYELYKHYIFYNCSPTDPWSKLLCGGMTGITASLLTYPLDLIRTYLAINVHNDPTENGIWNTGVKVYKREGAKGLFKGLNASLIGIVPYIGFKMGSFDFLKNICLPEKTHPWFNTINLLLGAVAGTVAVTLTYPADVIRRKIQIMGSPQ